MPTFTTSNPTTIGEPTKKDDYDKVFDNTLELADIIEGITTGSTVGDSDATAFRVDKVSTTIAGAGLTGGGTTSLSVDGITEQSTQTELKIKVLDIGDWNMDVDITKDVLHGLTLANIRSAEVWIRRDSDDYYYPIDYAGAGVYFLITSAVHLSRTSAYMFDSTNFDSTGYNRGWVNIWYTTT